MSDNKEVDLGTAEICLLIVALYTLVLLIIATQYSTRTIETLGDLVHQLINKIDSHNETVLKDIHALIEAVAGKPLTDDSDDSDDSSENEEKSELQNLFESAVIPSQWTSYSHTRPANDKNDSQDDVSRTTVINPYDKSESPKAS